MAGPPVGRPGFSDTKTNSAQAEAGARAELDNKGGDMAWLAPYIALPLHEPM